MKERKALFRLFFKWCKEERIVLIPEQIKMVDALLGAIESDVEMQGFFLKRRSGKRFAFNAAIAFIRSVTRDGEGEFALRERRYESGNCQSGDTVRVR